MDREQMTAKMPSPFTVGGTVHTTGKAKLYRYIYKIPEQALHYYISILSPRCGSSEPGRAHVLNLVSGCGRVELRLKPPRDFAGDCNISAKVNVQD